MFLIHYLKLPIRGSLDTMSLREGDLFQRALQRRIPLQVQLWGDISPWHVSGYELHVSHYSFTPFSVASLRAIKFFIHLLGVACVIFGRMC